MWKDHGQEFTEVSGEELVTAFADNADGDDASVLTDPVFRLEI